MDLREQAIQDAIRSLESGTFRSQRKAAQAFGVPRTTLQSRIHGSQRHTVARPTERRLPSNVHVSVHPCLRAKLSQLRSKNTQPREARALIHDLALLLGYEATASSLGTVADPQVQITPLGYQYSSQCITPAKICLVPILRNGLGMVEALHTILPDPVPVYHLGLFREPTTLQPVEYYNKLPYCPQSNAPQTTDSLNPFNPGHANASASDLAILLDPVIATGGTCVASIQTLKKWGVKKILVISVLGARDGVERAAREWAENVEIWLGGMDEVVDAQGLTTPGLGDISHRLFLT
ncbi:hypothetical protein K3495_g14943 [Podosphaera aphanis]|nr:hypothetical protein K3495_g14943 [Podosphaera aphanis]